MQMRGWMFRILRVAFIAAAAWLAFHLLRPQGLGWTVPVAAAVAALAWIAFRMMQVRRHREEDSRADRWAEALMDPPLRPGAIRELRAELGALDGKKHAARHARLTLVLAELLEADGDPAAAREALGAVRLGALTERTRTMVQHARAVAALSAGDVEGAAELLDALAPVGERELDLRVRALRGFVLAEKGEAERALELAEELRIDAASDADLRMEARVLKAVALDVAGDRADAVKVLRALGEEMLGVLLVLGLPRVRELADLALDED
ncbi:MAG: hypothetical protein M5U28_37005 [Sandaracinaceae bacterium]|nr:hypothetical protein [Sandaracinaceae bacterium]